MTTRQDLAIRAGATWAWTYASGDDLTGYAARMAIRDGYGGALRAYLSTGSDADGGTITLGDDAGTVALAMTAAETTGLVSGVIAFGADAAPVGRTVALVYDLELVDAAGAVSRALEGRVIVHREVTE